MSTAEVQEKLDRAGLATANVNTPANLWDHPQLVHRQRWVEVDSLVGAVPALLPPGHSDRYRPRMDAILEEHDIVYREVPRRMRPRRLLDPPPSMRPGRSSSFRTRYCCSVIRP